MVFTNNMSTFDHREHAMKKLDKRRELYKPTIFNDEYFFSDYERKDLMQREYKTLFVHMVFSNFCSDMYEADRREAIKTIVSLFKQNKLHTHVLSNTITKEMVNHIREEFHLFQYFPFNYMADNGRIDTDSYLKQSESAH